MKQILALAFVSLAIHAAPADAAPHYCHQAKVVRSHTTLMYQCGFELGLDANNNVSDDYVFRETLGLSERGSCASEISHKWNGTAYKMVSTKINNQPAHQLSGFLSIPKISGNRYTFETDQGRAEIDLIDYFDNSAETDLAIFKAPDGSVHTLKCFSFY